MPRDITHDDPNKQQKARAQRVDRTYYAKAHPWRTRMRVLSFLLPLAGGAALLGMNFAKSGVQAYLPGPVSAKHASFADRCDACHETEGGKFGAVTDAKCSACHDGPVHSPRQEHAGTPLGPMEPMAHGHGISCASCHTEHMGHQRLAEISDRHCTQCHADLKVNDGKPLTVHGKIAGFAKDQHPDWKILRDKTPDPTPDPSKIRLNHKLHMTGEAGRPKKFTSGPKIGMEVGCTDCHQTDKERAYMVPISFDAHCVACHEGDVKSPKPELLAESKIKKLEDLDPAVRAMVFFDRDEKGIPKPNDKGEFVITSLKLHGDPHAISGKVGRVLWDHYERNEGKVLAFKEVVKKVRKGPKVVEETVNELAPYEGPKEAWVADRTRELTKGVVESATSCKKCHESKPEDKIQFKIAVSDKGLLPVVQRPEIPIAWLTKSKFNHGVHRVVTCVSCHLKMDSVQTTDVLLPDVKNCQECHKQGGARAGCMECHVYHDKKNPKMEGTLSIEELIKGPAKKSGTP